MEEDIAEEQRIILDVISSEIEHPSDVIQSSHEHCVAALAHLSGDVLELALHALSGVFLIENPHLLLRHWRPISTPDLINQGTSSHQLDTSLIKVLLSNLERFSRDLILINSNH